MKTMSDYTIYCTEEQVKKALKLRAPISEAMSRYNSLLVYKSIEQGKKTKEYYNNQGIAICGTRTYKIPTAEQMIRWLEDKGLLISITACNTPDNPIYNYSINRCEESWNTFPSRKKVTLAAIDAALEYLENNEKIKSKNSTV